MADKWTKEQALDALADGHTLWTLEAAKSICEAMGVPFSDKLITHYDNQKDANPDNDPKGLWLNDPNKAIDGVNSLSLSDYVTLKIIGGEIPPSSEFMGRGFGAQANVRAIKAFLEHSK